MTGLQHFDKEQKSNPQSHVSSPFHNSLGNISGSTRRKMGIISGLIWGSFQGWRSFRSRDHFGGCTDLPRFLDSVLQRTDQISPTKVDEGIMEQHIVIVDQTVRLLRILRDSSSTINAHDKETLDNLSSAFSDVLSALQQCSARAAVSPTTVAKNVCPRLKSGEPGKPAFDISAELLEDLLGLGFTYTRIAHMLGVSRWTISRRIKDYGLEDLRSFSKLSDDELDDIVQHIREHGATSGQVYMTGYLRSLGLRVQRRRERECLARLDPQNRALRWGILVSRRVYQVPWPNSLWHLDGHHSLIRWKLVVHGYI